MILRCTDAHCHADFTALSGGAAMFSQMFLCVDACFGGDWKKLADFDLYPIKKAFGLHPDLRTSEFDDLALAEEVTLNFILPSLEEFMLCASAVGEAGLDASIVNRVPLALQRKVFIAQLKLAQKYKLGVIVHCVDQWGELLEILQSWQIENSQKKFMLHAAKCSAEMSERFAKIGGYFSFGLRELNSKKGAQTAAAVPIDRLLVETDSVPSRALIEQTVSLLAEIRSTTPFDLSEQIYKNFNCFFK